MNKERTLGKLALAGALAFGGMGATAGTTSPTEAATVRTVNCNKTVDKWYPLRQGEYNVVKASAVILPADVTVDGVRQFDDNADTATVTALKSKDNKNKTWVIYDDYAGSMFVLKCGATYTSDYTAIGRQLRLSDRALGVNNPKKGVWFNEIEK